MCSGITLLKLLPYLPAANGWNTLCQGKEGVDNPHIFVTDRFVFSERWCCMIWQPDTDPCFSPVQSHSSRQLYRLSILSDNNMNNFISLLQFAALKYIATDGFKCFRSIPNLWTDRSTIAKYLDGVHSWWHVIYYSTGVQIVSCTLSSDSVLSDSTGLFNPVLSVSANEITFDKKLANQRVSFNWC